MLLLSWQLAASINFSPFTNIHQAAVLAHHFCDGPKHYYKCWFFCLFLCCFFILDVHGCLSPVSTLTPPPPHLMAKCLHSALKYLSLMCVSTVQYYCIHYLTLPMRFQQDIKPITSSWMRILPHREVALFRLE